jgi:methionyl-tRNA formyltransferase
LPSPQSNDAVYCHLIKKEDAFINPAELTAAQAERHVRAYLAFPKTKMTVLDQSVIITKAHTADESVSALDIQCKDGKILSIDELVGPTGRTMSAAAFLNGYAG